MECISSTHRRDFHDVSRCTSHSANSALQYTGYLRRCDNDDLGSKVTFKNENIWNSHGSCHPDNLEASSVDQFALLDLTLQACALLENWLEVTVSLHREDL